MRVPRSVGLSIRRRLTLGHTDLKAKARVTQMIISSGASPRNCAGTLNPGSEVSKKAPGSPQGGTPGAGGRRGAARFIDSFAQQHRTEALGRRTPHRGDFGGHYCSQGRFEGSSTIYFWRPSLTMFPLARLWASRTFGEPHNLHGRARMIASFVGYQEIPPQTLCPGQNQGAQSLTQSAGPETRPTSGSMLPQTPRPPPLRARWD